MRRQFGRQMRIAHRGNSLAPVDSLQWNNEKRLQVGENINIETPGLLPRFQIDAERHTKHARVKRIAVLGDVDGNHFAAMIGRPDFYGRQFHRNFCERRGNLFYPMRKKFHYQTETGEGARQLDWDSAAIRRMKLRFGISTSSEGRAPAPTIS